MSQFTETMYGNAQWSLKGMVTGEPDTPVRHTWAEVHERAARVAGGLAAAGIGHGDAVAVLAGAPVEIAPTAQGIWMRGASLTMLHQPTPRTDLVRWAEETTGVINMISAKAVVVSEPFMAAAPVLSGAGMTVLTIEALLAHAPVGPVDTDDDDVALMQLTSGSTGSPKAVQITHANIVANAEAMVVGCNFDVDTDVIVSWLPCFHDMGMTGYLTVPMYIGAELVKVTPMDFLRDTLLWAKLIDKYHGTMTAAPNFAYNLFAKRLRRQATPGEFDLSSLRWALSGAEQVDPLDVEDLCDAGAPFGLRPEAIIPAYGMAETTVAVSFSECGGGMVVDEVDADLLAVLHRAIPATRGHTRRLVALGKPLEGLEVRIVDEDGSELPARGVGVIEVRGDTGDQGLHHGRPDSSRRRTSAAGTTPATWAISPRPAMWWCAGASRTSSSWPDATSTRPTSNAPRAASPGCGPVAPSRCGWTPGCRGRRSRWPWSARSSTITTRCAASSGRSHTRCSPRSTCGPAMWWCSSRARFPRRHRASCDARTPCRS